MSKYSTNSTINFRSWRDYRGPKKKKKSLRNFLEVEIHECKNPYRQYEHACLLLSANHHTKNVLSSIYSGDGRRVKNWTLHFKINFQESGLMGRCSLG